MTSSAGGLGTAASRSSKSTPAMTPPVMATRPGTTRWPSTSTIRAFTKSASTGTRPSAASMSLLRPATGSSAVAPAGAASAVTPLAGSAPFAGAAPAAEAAPTPAAATSFAGSAPVSAAWTQPAARRPPPSRHPSPARRPLSSHRPLPPRRPSPSRRLSLPLPCCAPSLVAPSGASVGPMVPPDALELRAARPSRGSRTRAVTSESSESREQAEPGQADRPFRGRPRRTPAQTGLGHFAWIPPRLRDHPDGRGPAVLQGDDSQTEVAALGTNADDGRGAACVLCARPQWPARPPNGRSQWPSNRRAAPPSTFGLQASPAMYAMYRNPGREQFREQFSAPSAKRLVDEVARRNRKCHLERFSASSALDCSLPGFLYICVGASGGRRRRGGILFLAEFIRRPRMRPHKTI